MADASQRLYRSRNERMLAGVGGGLAVRLGLDPTIVRVIWVLATIFLGGFPGIVAYLILVLVVPEEP
jgi:phage shock protein C